MDVEDLRLAYVSVTRAIRQLDMSEWALISPKNRPVLPSDLGESRVSEQVILSESQSEISNSRHGMKWTYVEDLDLIRFCKSGRTVPEISVITGRSISSLEARLAKWFLHASLGEDARTLETKNFGDENWDDTKHITLLELWEEDLDIEQLAKELDISLPRLAFQVINADLVIIDEAFDDAVITYYGL